MGGGILAQSEIGGVGDVQAKEREKASNKMPGSRFDVNDFWAGRYSKHRASSSLRVIQGLKVALFTGRCDET